MVVFLEHLCFIVLGVMGTKGQETERFLGARKPTRLLVGWEDSIFSLCQVGKECWKHLPTTGRTTLQMVIFNKLGRRYFTWYILLCFYLNISIVNLTSYLSHPAFKLRFGIFSIGKLYKSYQYVVGYCIYENIKFLFTLSTYV